MEPIEKLKKKIEEVLESKSFSDKAKENVEETLLFIYEHYTEVSYIGISKDDYIHMYLETIQNMNDYSIFSLNNINEDSQIAEIFRDGIAEAKENNGNLDYVDNRYVLVEAGPYYPSCKGFSWKRVNFMCTLEEIDASEIIKTCYHEMTRLSSGKNPYPLYSSIPFGFSLRKMFLEGDLSVRDSYLDLKTNYQVEVLKEKNIVLKICSEYSYPLYGMLYQMMQLLFGTEILEGFRRNDIEEISLFDVLKEKYPNLDIETIFAHLIYILSCYNDDSKVKYNKKKALETAIKHYEKVVVETHKGMAKKCISLGENITNTKEWIEENQKIEEEILDKLNDKKKLEEAFEHQMKLVKEETLKKYEEGIITNKEYLAALNEFDREGTIENFKLAQKQDLKLMEKTMREGEGKLERLQNEFDSLYMKKLELEENRFGKVLEEVCITNPSLLESIEYLKKVCSKAIQEDYTLSEDDEEHNVYLDKMKLFVHIKSQMVLSKTSK